MPVCGASDPRSCTGNGLPSHGGMWYDLMSHPSPCSRRLDVCTCGDNPGIYTALSAYFKNWKLMAVSSWCGVCFSGITWIHSFHQKAGLMQRATLPSLMIICIPWCRISSVLGGVSCWPLIKRFLPSSNWRELEDFLVEEWCYIPVLQF